ncbi:hypothetical protein HGA91_00685 [candidate division WWE3 bacterium]|nr:hypothetical protein [candidate division WWE3 bacterium]
MRFQFNTALIIRFFTILSAISMIISPVASANAFGVACPKESEVYIALFDSCLSFGPAISLTISWSLAIGTVLALAKLAIGAIQFSFSTGEPGKLANARATLTDAFLGIILIASAWIIFRFISGSLPDQWDIDLLFFDLS